MTSMDSNAGQIARRFEQRASALPGAVRRGVRDVVLAVERNAVKRLTGGSAAPGSYPVPVRVGHLRRSTGARVLSDTSGMVFNRARYANAIHEGFRPYGNPHAAAQAGRPYLDDAVDDTPIDAIMHKRLQQVFA